MTPTPPTNNSTAVVGTVHSADDQKPSQRLARLDGLSRRLGKRRRVQRRQRLQLAYLLDQVGLLIVELLIVGPVCVEVGEELHQLLLVTQKDVQDGAWLVRVRHKYLTDRRPIEKMPWHACCTPPRAARYTRTNTAHPNKPHSNCTTLRSGGGQVAVITWSTKEHFCNCC